MKRIRPLKIMLTVLGMAVFSQVVSGQTVSAAEVNNDQLPIRKVVLYKHGVGYFERRGNFDGPQNFPLYFKKEQMNDLLKSLTVLDLAGGGTAGAITYDSTRTTEQLLKDYSFTIQGKMGLPQILAQLQGSRVEIALGVKTIRGCIMGVEERQVHPLVYYLAILEESGVFQNINMNEVTGVKCLDTKLEKSIQDYLQTLFQQHRRDEKTLTISLDGPGRHDLLVSYVTETPVWKATYRIVLPGEQKEKSPFLQGWAVVDNVSEEDWQEVQLSLVSGLPISFVQNLYDPIYKKRPVIAVQEEAAVAPMMAQEGMPPAPAAAAAGEAMMDMTVARKAGVGLRAIGMAGMGGRMGGMMEMGKGMGLGGAMAPVDLEAEMRRVEAQTVTQEVGDLFEYALEQPVSIARNKSALLPIVAREVGGETVSLYNESARADNPLSAVRLKNSTGLTLEGGPLTVYQGNSYVGEALMKTVKPDEQRYITYAVDLGLKVDTKHDGSRDQVERVVINRGVMTIHRYLVETKTYNLNNKDARAKTVVIEHPFRKDWKLLEPQKPLERTDDYLRFEVQAAARGLSQLAVKEQHTIEEKVLLTNITPDDIAVYFRSKYITDKTRQQLETIMALKTEVVELDRQIQVQTANRETIFKDQGRVRENLRSLRDTAEERNLRSRYIRQMEEQENQLQEIDKTIRQLQQQRTEKQTQMDQAIESLEQDIRL